MVFLSAPFRPFFLGAALYAMIAMLLWIITYAGWGGAALQSINTVWHIHEMLFGFASAVIAGFFLTAVANWTKRPAINGWRLGILLGLWLAGRIAMFLWQDLNSILVLMTDLAFLLLLLGFAANEIIRGGNRRNYPLLLILGLLFLCNLVFHVFSGGESFYAYQALGIAMHLILLLIVIIGGRIIPAFTRNWLQANNKSPLPAVHTNIDLLAIIVTLLVGIVDNLMPYSSLSGWLALVAAMVHALRLSHWCGWQTRTNPLLFVLHTAYLWLVLGYILLGISVLDGSIPRVAAIHALTIGGMGTMILAMISRVSLGHTKRELVAAKPIVLAYWLISLACILRIFSSNGLPLAQTLMFLSALCWVIAFGLFAVVYWPILVGPPAQPATTEKPRKLAPSRLL